MKHGNCRNRDKVQICIEIIPTYLGKRKLDIKNVMLSSSKPPKYSAHFTN